MRKTLLSCLAALTVCSLAARADDLETLRSRYLAKLLEDRARADLLEEAVGRLRPDGSYPDVIYQTTQHGAWPADKHLVRLVALARRVHESGRSDARAAEALHRALRYWLAAKPLSLNWFWNELVTPGRMLKVLFLAEGELTPPEVRAALEIACRSTIDGTGQNLVWYCQNVMARALYQRDAKLLREAIAPIVNELRLSDCEGIRPDFCFHQHGRQPQFGNYGLSFLSEMLDLREFLAGTSFAFPPDRDRLLHDLYGKGFLWVVWNGYMEPGSQGRIYLRNGCGSRGRRVVSRRSSAFLADCEDPVGYKFFDCSAFSVFRTDGWMASVKMSSPTVIGSEFVNEENLKGHYSADGALFTLVTGAEYENVFPLWNWRQVPGITNFLAPEPQPTFNGDRRTGAPVRTASDFVVGAGTNGVAATAMIVDKEGLLVHKAWFFSPSCVVCLGAGITSRRKEPVVTAVEQACAAEGAGPVKGPPGDPYVRSRNGAVGYLVRAPEDAVSVRVEARHQPWKTIVAMATDDCRGEVFSETIRHGVQPKGATYEYWVVPGRGTEIAAWDPSREAVVLRNDATAQIVAFRRQGVAVVVASRPGTYPIRGKAAVKLSKPGVGFYVHPRGNGGK